MSYLFYARRQGHPISAKPTYTGQPDTCAYDLSTNRHTVPHDSCVFLLADELLKSSEALPSGWSKAESHNDFCLTSMDVDPSINANEIKKCCGYAMQI